MAAPSSGPGRAPWLLYVLLGLAVLVGVVASLLSGASPSPPPTHAGQLTVELPAQVWGLLMLSPLLVGVGVLIARRFTEGTSRLSSRDLAAFAVLIVFLLLVVYLLHPVGSGAQGTISISKGQGPGCGNCSKVPPPPPPPHNSSPKNGTAVAPSFVVNLGPWVLWLLVLGVTAIVAALAVPGVISRLADRSSRPPRRPPAGPAVQSALADAAAAIDRGEDPREVVVRLYIRLLDEVAPRFGDVSVLTPDEIRSAALLPLGVSPPPAEALTRAFEEARYSTHDIGEDDASRFREAIRTAEVDLARSSAS